jgi:hypothetical protein
LLGVVGAESSKSQQKTSQWEILRPSRLLFELRHKGEEKDEAVGEENHGTSS